MSTQRLLLVLTLAIALILGGLWLAFSGSRASSGAGAVAGNETLLPQPGPRPDAALVPAGVDSSARGAARSDLSSEELIAAPDADAAGVDLDQARWIEVQIRAPHDATPDDTLHVLAIAAGEGDGGKLRSLRDQIAWQGVWKVQRELLTEQSSIAWTRRPVENGVARIPFSPESTRAYLMLDGRFLFLDTPFELDLEGADDRVAIDASLGAYVHIRPELPAGAAERGVLVDELEGEVRLEASWMFRGGSRGRPIAYAFDLGEGLDLEVRGAPPTSLFNLTGKIDSLAPASELGLRFEANEEHTITARFTLGGEVRGRVLDSNGSPIAGAELRRSGGGMMFMGRGEQPAQATSDEQGQYRLLGAPAGKLTLEVEAGGWVRNTTDEMELTDGQVVTGLDIVLDRGAHIAGRVLSAEGQPLEGARIEVRGGRGRRGPWQPTGPLADVHSDEAGDFTVWGLAEGEFEVIATLGREPERREWRFPGMPDESGEAGESEDDEPVPPRSGWRASATGVPTGTEDLELVLVELLALRGTLRDDQGAVIPEFRISARSAEEASTPWGGSPPIETTVENSMDGSFEVWGLHDGDWTVEAAAEGHAASDASKVDVAIPQAGASLELILSRAASLVGRVVDPAGLPARARVTASTGGRQGWMGRGGSRAESGADGTFELKGLPLGTLTVRADSDDWASSEPITVELSVAQVLGDVVLELRVGGRLTGDVFDAEGEPSPGRRVSVSESAMGGGIFGNGPATVTDGAGFFAMEHVTPGTWVVSAGPSEERMLEMMSSAEDQSAMMDMFSSMDTASVDIVDGAETHVTLGADPLVPVHLVGRVLQAGDALAEVQVIVVSEGGSLLKGMKMLETETDGSFETTVDRPGAYVITVSAEGRGGQVRFPVDIPEVEEHAVELVLPSGRIEGTVLTSEGEPASGVRMSLSADAEAGSIFNRGNDAQTDAEGHFEFVSLWDGTYTVRAGASNGFFGGGARSRYGTSILGGIRVGVDETVRGVDLTLAGASAVKGTVRDEQGDAVSGATIFVRDEVGRLLSTISGTTTNAAGKFEYTGVSPGMVTVSARAQDRASPASAPVRVIEDEAAEVSLTLESGTMLRIEVVDEEGEPLRAQVQVFDENDFEVGSMMTVAAMQEVFTEGISTRETKVGPLPAGKYRVEAEDRDGRSARKPVTLKGQESRKVKLRLKDR